LYHVYHTLITQIISPLSTLTLMKIHRVSTVSRSPPQSVRTLVIEVFWVRILETKEGNYQEKGL